MPGLLDLTDDPLFTLGAGLLSASGQSLRPVSFGQVLGAGANALQEAKINKQKNDLEALQMEQLKQKIEQQKLQQNALRSYFDSMQGNNAQTALTEGAQAGSVGPTVANAQRMNAMPVGAGDLNKLQALAASGYDTKSLFDMYKYANDGIKREAGQYYRNPLTGRTEYIADPTKGIDIDPVTGKVITMPGAANSMAEIEGAKTGAQERSKAQYDVLDPSKFITASGAPFAGTRMDFINQTRQQALPQTQISGADATGLDLSKLSPQQIQYLQKQDPAAFSAGVARFGQTFQPTQQSQSGNMLQTEAERAARVGAVNAGIEVEKQRQIEAQTASTKSSKLYEQLTAAIPMAREYLKTATGSGVGAMADSAMGFFGKSTPSSNAADQLDTLAGWMVSNVPRMEGPQSDKDVLQYKAMAGMVGDRTKPVESRLKALDTLEALQNKYRDININLNGAQPNLQPQATKNISDFGYRNQQDVINDARNTIMKNPSSKAEVIRRLEAIGITNHGLK